MLNKHSHLVNDKNTHIREENIHKMIYLLNKRKM